MKWLFSHVCPVVAQLWLALACFLGINPRRANKLSMYKIECACLFAKFVSLFHTFAMHPMKIQPFIRNGAHTPSRFPVPFGLQEWRLISRCSLLQYVAKRGHVDFTADFTVLTYKKCISCDICISIWYWSSVMSNALSSCLNAFKFENLKFCPSARANKATIYVTATMLRSLLIAWYRDDGTPLVSGI